MNDLLRQLNLTDITLVCQDWGGLIGLRLVADHPDRFAAVVAANTGLPTGDHPISDAFLAWRNFSLTSPEFRIGDIIKMGCAAPVTADVVAAYDAPFPDDSYKAGARVFSIARPHHPG